MKVLLLTVVLDLLFAGQDEAQLLLKPVDYQRWCNLGGGLGVYVCVLFGVWSCGFISLAISLQLKVALFTGSIRVLHGLRIISAVCSLALMPVHCSCKTDLTAHGLELL